MSGRCAPHIRGLKYGPSRWTLCNNLPQGVSFVLLYTSKNSFILSKEAQEIMSAIDFTTPTNPLANPPKEAIKITDTDLIDYDANLAAKQKEEVLEKWSQIVD